MVVQTETARVEELVDRLARFEPDGSPVLSLYLDTRPNERGRDAFDVFVRKELKARGESFPSRSAERQTFDRDAERIREWLREAVDPAANGVAAFACRGAGLFETVQLGAPMGENRLHVAPHPHLYPLARVLDLYRRYAVLVSDTHLARIFVFGLGTRLRQDTVENEKLHRTDVGGWSQMQYQRHIDSHRAAHAREVVEALERIVRQEGVEHVVLAGDEVALPLLKAQLPEVLQPRLVDVLQMDARSPEHEVLQATLEALRRHDAATDAERVQRVLDEYRAGGLGVVGVHETEAALALAQVHELVISADPTAVREDGDAPPDREAQIELCDRLVTMARQTDAAVHFVEEAGLLAGVGGVGAALRYRLPVQDDLPELLRENGGGRQ
jgi:peptide subunit release factor 1 (eRF1)